MKNANSCRPHSDWFDEHGEMRGVWRYGNLVDLAKTPIIDFLEVYVNWLYRWWKGLEGYFLNVNFVEPTQIYKPLQCRVLLFYWKKAGPTFDILRGPCKRPDFSTSYTQACLDPPKSKWRDGQRQINEAENVLWRIQPFELNYGVAFVFSVPRGCTNRICLFGL